jgi:predicted P-loop ATPase
MSAAAAYTSPPLPSVGNPYGGPLTPDDYRELEKRWIDRKSAEVAMLSRVPDYQGRELLGQKRMNCSGLLIPYFWPEEASMRCYRIRRDHPEIERGKPKAKYLGPPNERLKAYIPPECAGLDDPQLPIVITEGEFKAIALYRLALHNTDIADGPRFLPISVSGVYAWRGTIGTVSNEKGARVPEKGPIPDLDRIKWTGRRVTIAFDADVKDNGKVRAARYQLSQELRSRGAEVGILEWDAAQGKGVDDWLANVGPDAVLKALEGVDFNRTTGWKAKLKCSAMKKDGSGGKPLALLTNVMAALTLAPEWEGVFGFDEFRQRVRVLCQPPVPGSMEFPRDWTDADDTWTTKWMQDNGIDISGDSVGRAVHALALENSYHPLRDWLESLQWDGDRRLDSWLSEYLGAAPSEYVAAVGKNWLISAVARVLKPGSKVDSVLVLEGPQGAGKSTAFRILAGDEYFCDTMPDIHSKDAQIQTFGSWIIEWGELDAMSRAETTAIKGFITRQSEKLRFPFGKRAEDVPRQCVFCGTSNDSEYLKDETGNRRFWPVRVGVIDNERLAADRDQLWAEAVVRFKNRENWYLDRPELIKAAEEETGQRVEIDPWFQPIADYVGALSVVRAEDVLRELGKQTHEMTQTDRRRVGRCLKLLKFEASKTRKHGRCFVKGAE